ncbi:MAG: inositol monophosphatase family protein [Candidatus Korobacteraceae bacterium]
MTRYTPDIEPIIREAGALLMSYLRRRIGYEYKGDVDLVTEADRASEKFISERLRSRWPDFGILGEEGTRSDMAAEYRWLVDPLDGTTNFAHGYPVFCISIALVRGEDLLAGFLYDPTRDEFFAAEHGAGAKLNGQAMHVSKTKTLSESLLGTGFPSHKRHKNPNVHFYHQLTLRSHGLRRAGSAALDLANVACGRYEGFWEFNLNPWDTAAGVLLVREAGGMVTRFDGSPFLLNSREVLASNAIIHQELMDNFAEIFAGRGLEEIPSPVEYARQRS